ncbi:hypothetical protein BYT27DRAFT_7116232, partial [Phlegmacium glaucopus]
IVSDCSLFATYTPSCRVHCTAFSNDITIKGIGDVHICIFAAGKYILFHMKDCWHVLFLPHHFLSCNTLTSNGYQIMFAAHTPRVLFPNKRHLSELNLPKYVPLTRVGGYLVLKYETPILGSVSSHKPSISLQRAGQGAISLHASAYQPFAGLSILSQPHFSSSHSCLAPPLLSTSSSLSIPDAFSVFHLSPPVIQASLSQPFYLPISHPSTIIQVQELPSPPCKQTLPFT